MYQHQRWTRTPVQRSDHSGVVAAVGERPEAEAARSSEEFQTSLCCTTLKSRCKIRGQSRDTGRATAGAGVPGTSLHPSARGDACVVHEYVEAAELLTRGLWCKATRRGTPTLPILWRLLRSRPHTRACALILHHAACVSVRYPMELRRGRPGGAHDL